MWRASGTVSPGSGFDRGGERDLIEVSMNDEKIGQDEENVTRNCEQGQSEEICGERSFGEDRCVSVSSKGQIG